MFITIKYRSFGGVKWQDKHSRNLHINWCFMRNRWISKWSGPFYLVACLGPNRPQDKMGSLWYFSHWTVWYTSLNFFCSGDNYTLKLYFAKCCSEIGLSTSCSNFLKTLLQFSQKVAQKLLQNSKRCSKVAPKSKSCSKVAFNYLL